MRRAVICRKPNVMRISTSLSWVCAATLILGGLTAWADPDTESQIKAREALRKAMNQPPASPSAPAPARPAPALVAPAAPAAAPVAVPAPAAAPDAAYSGTVVMPPRADPAVIEKAREALRQKMQETPAVEAPAKPAKPAKPAPAPKPEKPAKLARPEKPEKSEVKAEPKPGKARPALQPLQGPPSSLPAGKEARLAELLKRYKADQITPQEYHTERAKILAEP